MTVENYKVILSKLKNHPIREIKLMGMGEPFMHPKFHEICKLTRETFPKAFIISSTNCQYTLSGNLKKSLEFIDMLYLSIDGYKANYEKFRKPAKWTKLLKFLKDLKEINRFNCRLAINYTVNPENVYDIPRVNDLIEKFDLHELRLNIVQNWSEEQSASNIISGFSGEQVQYLRNNYQDKIKGKFGWNFNDCFWVKNGVYITSTGDIKICCMNTSSKSFGNILLDPSIQMSRSNKRFVEIKNGCESNSPVEHCKNCSYMELNGILKELL